MLGTKSWVFVPLALLLCSTANLSAAIHNLAEPHKTGEFIIKFKADPNFNQERYLRANNLVLVSKFMSGALLVKQQNHEQNSLSFKQLLTNLGSDEYIAYVETNTYVHSFEAVTPNDPQFSQTYGLHNGGQTGGKVGADIKAPEAWSLTKGSSNALVAVIDTGIDYNHPDLKDNYWSNPGESGLDANGKDKRSNGIDDDGNGFIDDWRGWNFVANNNNPFDDNEHGSHCAGTIGARGNNGIGVAGVNWQVSIVGIKFLDASGSGTIADAVKSLEYAIKIGVHITSNSWGGGGYSPTLDETIGIADSKGILFIAAAGNVPSDNDSTPHYPSSYTRANVIAVAATDHNDALANFSSYGAQAVHLAAPGVMILSTTPGNTYRKFSGTSMATPHVAGVAALVKGKYPTISHLQIKERILSAVDFLPALVKKVSSQGRLNAYNALEDDRIPPGEVDQLTLVGTTSSSVKFTFLPTGDDGNEGKASRYRARISLSAISSVDDWNKAEEVLMEKNEQGGYYVIDQLPFNYRGFVAIRAFDNVGNAGEVTTSLAFTLQTTTIYAEYNGENLEGFSVAPTWGLETLSSTPLHKAYSDSPGSTYANNANSALTMPDLKLPSTAATMVMDASYDFELNYDFCLVEISSDGGKTWENLKSISGKSSNGERLYLDIAKYTKRALTPIKVRFRITSDYSVGRDGIKISAIKFIGP